MASNSQTYPNSSAIAQLQTLIDSARYSLQNPSLTKGVPTLPYYQDETIVFEVDGNGHEVVRVKEGRRLKEAIEERKRIKMENAALLIKNHVLQMKLAATSEEFSRTVAQSLKDKQALAAKELAYRNLKNRFSALLQQVKPGQLYSAFLKEDEDDAIRPPTQEVTYRIIEIPVEREIIVEVPVQRQIEVVREVQVPVFVQRVVEVPAQPAVVYVQRIKEVPIEMARNVEVVKEVPVQVERIVEVEKIVEIEKIVQVQRIVQVERIVEREVEVPVEVEVQKIIYVERVVQVPVQRIVQKIVDREVLVEVQVQKIRQVIVEKEIPVEVQIERIVQVPVQKIVEVEHVVEKIVEVPIEKVVEVERIVQRLVEVPVEKIVEVQVIKQVPSQSNPSQLASLKAQSEILSRQIFIQSQQIENLRFLLQAQLAINNDNIAVIACLNKKILQISNNPSANGTLTFNGSYPPSPRNTQRTDESLNSSQNGQSLSRIKILSTHPRKFLPQAFRQDLNLISDPIVAQRLASAFQELSEKVDIQQRTNSRLSELLSSSSAQPGKQKEISLIQKAEAQKLALLGEISSLRRENHQLKVELETQEHNSETELLIENLTQQLQQERNGHSQMEEINRQLREALAKAERELLTRNRQAQGPNLPLRQ